MTSHLMELGLLDLRLDEIMTRGAFQPQISYPPPTRIAMNIRCVVLSNKYVFSD